MRVGKDLLPKIVATLSFLPCRHLRKYLEEDIVRDLTTSTSVQAELEKEWLQMLDDRKEARTIFPTGNSKVCSSSPLHLPSPLFHFIPFPHPDLCYSAPPFPLPLFHSPHPVGGSTRQPQSSDLECTEDLQCGHSFQDRPSPSESGGGCS